MGSRPTYQSRYSFGESLPLQARCPKKLLDGSELTKEPHMALAVTREVQRADGLNVPAHTLRLYGP
jgi:hypothetical protein